MKLSPSKKINDVIVKLLSTRTLPYYAEFMLYISQYEKPNMGTMGVNVTRKGMNLYYDPKFVDSLSEGELTFVLIHECFHLLFDHQRRAIHYNHSFSNTVMDMIINTIIMTDIVRSKHLSGLRSDFVQQMHYNNEFKENGEKNPSYKKPMGMYIPKQYEGKEIFENLYVYFKEQYVDFKHRLSKITPVEEEVNEDGEPIDLFGVLGYGDYGKYDVNCCSLDYIYSQMERHGDLSSLLMDIHMSDEVDGEEREAKIKDLMCKLQNRGCCSGDVEQTLNKIRQKRKDHLRKIKKHISNSIMGSHKIRTINKPNKHDIEGLKGRKKISNNINCILDTSGSMNDSFEKTLSYIFRNDVTINLIQIDTEIKSVEYIKNKQQLQRLSIKGLGGTTLQPAIQHIAETKLNNFNTVILTDGYTDELDFSNIKGNVLIVTTDTPPPIRGAKNNIKIIQIEKD